MFFTVKMYVYLLETTNTINFVSRVHNGGGTPLRPVEYDINEIVGGGDCPHFLEVVDRHISFVCMICSNWMWEKLRVNQEI